MLTPLGSLRSGASPLSRGTTPVQNADAGLVAKPGARGGCMENSVLVHVRYPGAGAWGSQPADL